MDFKIAESVSKYLNEVTGVPKIFLGIPFSKNVPRIDVSNEFDGAVSNLPVMLCANSDFTKFSYTNYFFTGFAQIYDVLNYFFRQLFSGAHERNSGRVWNN